MLQSCAQFIFYRKDEMKTILLPKTSDYSNNVTCIYFSLKKNIILGTLQLQTEKYIFCLTYKITLKQKKKKLINQTRIALTVLSSQLQHTENSKILFTLCYTNDKSID